MPKVLIVNGSKSYSDMFEAAGWKIVYNMEDCDLVQFCGGSDVDPRIYGEEFHPKACCAPERDVYEKGVFLEALERDLPMSGICRGAQFLHVMSGGTLYQHVNNHALSGTHSVTDHMTGEMLQVTSTHHQMMRYSPLGKVLATCSLSYIRSPPYIGENEDKVNNYPDIEVIWHEMTKCLCFQPHPEFNNCPIACVSYYFRLLGECHGSS